MKKIEAHVREKIDQLRSDRIELNRQLTEILFAEAFIKKQAVQAEPLEFLNLSTGFSQVKYTMLNTWPILSDDLDDKTELLRAEGDIHIRMNQGVGGK